MSARTVDVEPYEPDRTVVGKLRRRAVRMVHRRSVNTRLQRPMVSFSFDDAPLTAATTGAAILESRGCRGTFFVAAGLAGRVGELGPHVGQADTRRLVQAGHEIGCHTYSHLDCGRVDAPMALADVGHNHDVLQRWGVPRPTTFAYPFGDVNAATKRALAPKFTLLRALHHGTIRFGSDLNQAPAVGIEGADGAAIAGRWLDRLTTRPAWLVLYTHDVRPDPSSWGCTPETLAHLIDRARTIGADVVTIAEGAARVRASSADAARC